MIPESARFITSFGMLTVVGEETKNWVKSESLVSDVIPLGTTPKETLIRDLMILWSDFDRELKSVPFIHRMERGRITLEDYSQLLLNLRQQVMEGARWISRAASNFSVDNFGLRSLFTLHSTEEHRDFMMIEKDYMSIGGKEEEILSAEKNIGSEALNAWMFHSANQENPFPLLGAMFIIEGLGRHKAAGWGKMIMDQLGLEEKQVSFLLYHGKNDDHHMDHFFAALDFLDLNETTMKKVLKTAKVTARLYRLQLEEIGNK